MTMTFVTNKKRLVGTGAIVLLTAVIPVFAPAIVHAAASTTVSSDLGSRIAGYGTGYTIGLASLPAVMMWRVLLYLGQMFLSAILFIASFILDNVFYYNVALNPLYMPAVLQGWSIMRDIANAAFILIVLWIAFRIIFDVGGGEAKKFLIKVITIALLINFSLAMVSAVFAIANQLALPFRDAINPNSHSGISAIIVNRVKLHTSSAVPDQTSGAAQSGQNCGFNLLSSRRDLGVGCVEDGAARQFASSISSSFWNGFSSSSGLTEGMTLAITDLFLILTIVALLVAAGSLLIRLVAMVLLSVLAPAAFLAYALPTAGGKKMWDKWLNQLFCWAFYAPAFYFLFWLSLKILEVMTAGPDFTQAGQTNFAAFIFGMLPLIVFYFFLMAAVRVGKMMGCEGAGAAIDLGKKLTGMAVSGAAKIGTIATGAALAPVAGLAAQKAAAALQPGGKISGAVSRLGQIPGLSGIQRGTQGFLESQRQEINKTSEQYKGYGRDALFDQYQGARFDEKRRIALMQRITEGGFRRDFVKDPRFGAAELDRVLDSSAKYGAQYGILKHDPQLITRDNLPRLVPDAKNTRDAKKRVLKQVADPADISDEGLNDPEVQDVVLATKIKSQGDLKRIMNKSLTSYNNLINRFIENGDQMKNIFDDINGRAEMSSDEQAQLQNRWVATQNAINIADQNLWMRGQAILNTQQLQQQLQQRRLQQQQQQVNNIDDNDDDDDTDNT